MGVQMEPKPESKAEIESESDSDSERSFMDDFMIVFLLFVGGMGLMSIVLPY